MVSEMEAEMDAVLEEMVMATDPDLLELIEVRKRATLKPSSPGEDGTPFRTIS